MIHGLIATYGAGNIAEFGRRLLTDVINRINAAEVFGAAPATIILDNHEFAAVAYHLTAHSAMPEVQDREKATDDAISNGHMTLMGSHIISHDRLVRGMGRHTECGASRFASSN